MQHVRQLERPHAPDLNGSETGIRSPGASGKQVLAAGVGDSVPLFHMPASRLTLSSEATIIKVPTWLRSPTEISRLIQKSSLVETP